jgi:hypothetical protein
MRRALLITSVVILLLANTTGIYADRSVSSIGVTTRVLPVVKYEIIHQEKNLSITEENIKNGYIDVHGAVIFSVLTNSTNGYLLTFFVGRNLSKEVTVSYDSLSYRILETNNEVHMPFEGIKYVTKELSFRFNVSDILSPGIYDWPVAFMINAM